MSQSISFYCGEQTILKQNLFPDRHDMRGHVSKPNLSPPQPIITKTLLIRSYVSSYTIQSPNLHRQQSRTSRTRRRLAVVNHAILHPIRRTLRATNTRILRIPLQFRSQWLYLGNHLGRRQASLAAFSASQLPLPPLISQY
jgi:hypothetical protein